MSFLLLSAKEQGFVRLVLMWGRIAWEFEIRDEAVLNPSRKDRRRLYLLRCG